MSGEFADIVGKGNRTVVYNLLDTATGKRVKGAHGEDAQVVIFGRPDGTLKLDVDEVIGGRGSLGPAAVRDLLTQVRELYPDAKAIGGRRVQGARTGPAGTGPAEVSIDLDTALKLNARAYDATKGGRPTPVYPPGVKAPAGQGSVGEQLLRQELGPGARVPRTAGPFPHEAGQAPEIAKAFARTAGIADDPQSLISRTWLKGKTWWDKNFKNFWRLDPETQRPVIDRLRHLTGKERSTRERSLSALEHVIGRQMTAEDFSLFNMKVWADELLESATRPGDSFSLPGFDRTKAADLAHAEVARLEPFLRGNKVVQEALERHYRLQQSIGNELAQRGLINAKHVRRNYMHHQVMDYIRHKEGQFGPGVRQEPVSRYYTEGKPKAAPPGVHAYETSAMKSRSHQGIRDISRDYLRVQYEYMATTMEAMEVYDTIMAIARETDIRGPKGIKWNEGDPIPEGWVVYNTKSGFRGVEQTNAIDRMFTEQLEDSLVRDALAKAFHVGEDEVDHLIRQLMPESGEIKAHEFIIPREVALTLSDVASNRRKLDRSAFATATRYWKSFQLHKFPLQYNMRNFIGDFERATTQFGTEMFDVRRWRESFQEVWNAYRYRDLSPFMEDMQRYSVTSSGRVAVEVANIRNIENFDKLFAQMEGQPMSPALAGKMIKRAFEWLPRASYMREDVMRVYIAKMNAERLAAGKPVLSGISDLRGWDLSNPEHRTRAVAQVARDALGDYGNFTPTENKLREGLIPFYSWMKINLGFWPQLAKSVMTGNVRAPQAIAGASSAAIRGGAALALTMYTASHIWNNFIMEDAERSLPEYVRRQNHIILPDPQAAARGELRPWLMENDKGRKQVVHVRLPTALNDFASWFGLDGVAPELADFFEGRMSLQEYLTRRGEDAILDGMPIPAFMNHFVQSTTPVVSGLAASAGFGLFPDIRNPRRISMADRPGAVIQALGGSGIPLGAMGIAGTPSRPILPIPPKPRDVAGAALEQLGGYRTTASREDSYLRENRIELSRLENALQDAETELGRIQSGMAGQDYTAEERQQRVAQKRREIDLYVNQLRKKARRLTDLANRRQPIELQ